MAAAARPRHRVVQNARDRARPASRNTPAAHDRSAARVPGEARRPSIAVGYVREEQRSDAPRIAGRGDGTGVLDNPLRARHLDPWRRPRVFAAVAVPVLLVSHPDCARHDTGPEHLETAL